MRKTIIVAVCAVAAIGAGAVWLMGGSASPEASTITLPRLTTAQAAGKTLFDANCAACHGRNATGTEQGPPLVHIIYEPNHHGDASFYRALPLGYAHITGVSETWQP